MQLDETTVTLDELENRLDRLRILYDQYFTGIERSPPSVQHKDVERRIQVLRKMQLRNGAHRFRFQTLVQRYTTYLQYWQRIMRKIEEGTHKRDLARIARYGGGARKPNDSADRVYELDAEALEDVEEYQDLSTEDVEDEPETLRPAAPANSAAHTVTIAKQAPVPVFAEPVATKPITTAGSFFDTGSRQVETMPFDIVETVKAPAARPAPVTTPTPAVAPATAQVSAPAVATASPKTRVGVSVFGAPAQKSASVATASTAAPSTASAASATVAARQATSTPSGSAASPVRVQPTTPAQPRPAPAAAVDAELHSLYARYRDARKSNGESDVAFDTVAKQVKDTLPKLREKYPGAHVEIDVAVKDGKTILRPVVRSKKP
jgi:phosphoglycolate phosphatase-like HAD superfamily hydrolase